MTKKPFLYCCITGVFLAAGCSSPPTVVLEAPTLINPVCIGPVVHLKSGGVPTGARETGAFADTSEYVRKHLTIYVPTTNGDSEGIEVLHDNRKSNYIEESVLEKTAGKHDLSIRNLDFQIRSREFSLFLPGLLVNAFWEYASERAISTGRLVKTPLNRDRVAVEPSPAGDLPQPAEGGE